MKSTKRTIAAPAAKRAYKAPNVKTLGNVKKLTLKTGSNTDALGGHL